MRLRSEVAPRKRKSSGDTIVEVLIAIAIVSSVLAGAFSVSQKSALAVRDSQERAEMLQILQGQVELVRGLVLGDASSNPSVYTAAPYFCINPTTKQAMPYSIPSGSTTSPPSPCGNISGLYNVSITYNNAANVFTFKGWWSRLGGGTNNMQLSYRINP